MFYARIFRTKMLKYFCQSQNVTREKLHKALWYDQRVGKILMKLTPGVNFINFLQAAFMPSDPESKKKTKGLKVSLPDNVNLPRLPDTIKYVTIHKIGSRKQSIKFVVDWTS